MLNLIESRSIGGLSGSPVFVHQGLVRVKDGQFQVASNEHGLFFLLGIMHGHYATRSVEIDDTDTSDASTSKDRINMGIAIVVPIPRALEILERPEIKRKEAELAKAIRAATLPVQDLSQ